jgi:hypothetical protein
VLGGGGNRASYEYSYRVPWSPRPLCAARYLYEYFVPIAASPILCRIMRSVLLSKAFANRLLITGPWHMILYPCRPLSEYAFSFGTLLIQRLSSAKGCFSLRVLRTRGRNGWCTAAAARHIWFQTVGTLCVTYISPMNDHILRSCMHNAMADLPSMC